MKNIFILTIFMTLAAGCTAPYRISDRPTFNVVDQFKNKFQEQEKMKLVIDKQTKTLLVTKGPSGIFGAATIYEFNIGEAFSGHLTELFNNVFTKNSDNSLMVNVKIDSCDFSYENTMVHMLGSYEIDMEITTKFFQAEKLSKATTRKYHSKVDIPYTERTYGAQRDSAAVSAIDEIVEQLITDIVADKKLSALPTD